MDYCSELEGSEAKIRMSFWMKARSLVLIKVWFVTHLLLRQPES
jgi:hypothetical protein